MHTASSTVVNTDNINAFILIPPMPSGYIDKSDDNKKLRTENPLPRSGTEHIENLSLTSFLIVGKCRVSPLR